MVVPPLSRLVVSEAAAISAPHAAAALTNRSVRSGLPVAGVQSPDVEGVWQGRPGHAVLSRESTASV
jgi:hypothetical protein